MGEKKKISIKVISEISGYSIATVSRVINNNGRFSKETERKIKALIEEYGYQPNILARGLRNSKQQAIGVIVPDISNEFFAKTTITLQNQLMKLDYSTFICNTNEDSETEKKYLNMLQSQQVSGVIYVSGRIHNEDSFLNIPTVYIDRKPEFSTPKKFLLIESKNQEGGYIAAKRLIENGCRKIAIIAYESKISTHGDRLKGYKQALVENGISVDKKLIVNARAVDIDTGYNMIKELFSKNIEFDGVFCTSDLLAFGAIKALEEEQIAIPDKVQVIGFDDITIAKASSPSITTIRQSVETIGTIAADTIVEMIEGKTPKKDKYEIDVELISRETTR